MLDTSNMPKSRQREGTFPWIMQQYIEEFIKMGLDAWTPRTINDLDRLTAKYGDKLSLTVNVPGIANAKTEAEVRACIRSFVDDYAPHSHRVVATGLTNIPDKSLLPAAYEELYYDSSEYYAKVR